jgi:hypothetical protein
MDCCRTDKAQRRWTASPQRSLTASILLGALLAFTSSICGQDAPPDARGVPEDWTHHRLIFSNPGSAEEAIQNGSYGRWLKIVTDPRYVLQQRKQAAAANTSARTDRVEDRDDDKDGQPEAQDPGARFPDGRLPRGLIRVPVRPGTRPKVEREVRLKTPNKVRADWSMNMNSGATVGLGVFPAKFSFTTTNANCAGTPPPDFVVYNTGLSGSASQASIIAYDNLYTGCSAVPSVYWAYNTNGGAVTTSVVLSLDGSQVAFAQTNAGIASLTILKWAAIAGESPGSPRTLSVTSPGSYRTCTAPCMTSLTFAGSTSDSGSAPFEDYSSDSLYIGDDSGKLHKFTGVFLGTPAEASSPWPVSVSASALASPVYDSVSGNVFVGDYLLNSPLTCAASGNPCGFFYSVSASTGSLVGKSNRLDFVFGIQDGPIVDSSAGMAYVFVGADGESGVPSSCGTDVPCSGVFQFPTNFTGGSGTEATVGPGYDFLLSGSFDHAYLTSGSPSSPTGHIYVMGSTDSNTTLYQVSISSNVLNTTSTAGPVVSNNVTNGYFAPGLQVSEFYNGTTDYIFLSVLAFGSPATCSDTLTSGCVMGFDVTSGSISGSTTPTAATTEAGGTSGIIIDNSSAFSGASNIYFTPLSDQLCTTSATTGGCAIQTSQATP